MMSNRCWALNYVHVYVRVLARIKFKHPKKHVATTMTRHLWEIFLVKCQKQAFSFNKREAKLYSYAFLHVLTCIKYETKKKNIFFLFLVSCVNMASLGKHGGAVWWERVLSLGLGK
jgi:hypothetical protein